MILVTGGSGFIGSNLIAGLEDLNVERLVVCDVFGDKDKWCNLAKRDLYDCIDPHHLFSFMDAHKSKIQTIFHMGAISDTTETNVDLILENNYRLSMDLLYWCGRNRVRLIYASSAATYGDGSDGFVDDPSRVGLSKLRPLNPYGWSKHMVDRAIAQIRDLSSNDDYALPPQYVGLKFFNVYGPNEYHKGSQMSVIPQIFKQIRTNSVARLFKSDRPDFSHGEQLRDFIYVKDCVDVMLWLYKNPEVSGLFNVGTGQARSFLDLAKSVFTAMNLEPKIDFIDMPDILKGKYQYFTQSDATNLRAAGYIKEFTSLEDGVTDYVQNYLLQENMYR